MDREMVLPSGRGSARPSRHQPAARSARAARTGLTSGPASALERAALVAFAFWVPLDSRVSVLGTGLGTLLLLGMLGLLLLVRAGSLGRVARQPHVALLGLLLAFALAIELYHPASSLGWWSRLFQMVIGVMVVAAVARDARTIQLTLRGIVTSGVVVATLLTFSSWSTYAAIEEVDGTVTGQGRIAALDGTILGQGSVNTAAIFTAAAGAVAITLALTASARTTRLIYGTAATACFVGAAFSVSRGALLSGVVAAMAAVFSQRRRLGRRALTAVVVAVALFLILPSSVFGRVVDTTIETPGGKRDSRVVLWEAVGRTLDQTVALGVGEGGYEGGWAFQNGFTRSSSRVFGTHSSLTQMLVFWGIVPAALLVCFVVSLLRKVARGPAPPEIRLPVLVFLVALVVELVLSHSLQGKQYALGFGLALGLVTWFPRRAESATVPVPGRVPAARGVR